MESRKPAVKDYYAALEVPPDATPTDIKKAYRSLVQRYHPDRIHSQEDAGFAYQRMIEINEAFAVLSDRKRRADHDRQRAAGKKPPPRVPQTPEEWESLVTVTEFRTTPPDNPALDQTLAQEFLQRLKILVAQKGAPLKLREEREKAWLWTYLGKTWGRNYWVGLRLCPALSPSVARESLARLQDLVGKRRSGWKGNSFLFILAFQALTEGEGVLKMCRAYCSREENCSRRNLVNIVVLDLKHRRSILCGKRTRDPKLSLLLSALAAG